MSRYCQGFLLISLDSLSFPSPLSFYISSTRFFRILAGSWYSCTRCKSGFRFAFVFLFLIYLRKWFEEKQIGFVFFWIIISLVRVLVFFSHNAVVFRIPPKKKRQREPRVGFLWKIYLMSLIVILTDAGTFPLSVFILIFKRFQYEKQPHLLGENIFSFYNGCSYDIIRFWTDL